METKGFAFDLKEVDETGSFDGYAAVFGNVDLGGDVLEAGSLTKTISERPSVPILWQHDPYQPIGVGSLAADAKGLAVKGKLSMQVQRAREAHALMQDGALQGLSIGYRAVKKTYANGVRLLKEVAVFEFSPVTFPMNELATVGSVKDLTDRLRDGTASRTQLQAAIESLQALLDEPAEATRDNGAAAKEAEPELLHSLLSALSTLKEHGR